MIECALSGEWRAGIESHLVEKRVFKPTKEFSKKARIQSLAQYRELWEESVNKPEKFWAREAAELALNSKDARF